MQRAELMVEVRATAWALRPEYLAGLVQAIVDGAAIADGVVLTAGPEDGAQAAVRGQPNQQGQVLVLPVVGIMRQRGGGLFEMLFGGASLESLGRALRGALANPDISAIVLDIDSPGGSVMGVDELATELRNARGTKPIIALANGMAASAAYWLGTAADELWVTPSGEVGSVGVWAAHVDESGFLEKLGERVTLVSAGKYKVEGNPYEPLGEEARAYLQERVDDYYGMFVRTLAKNRGVSAETVREQYGEGRMVGAAAALKAGMVDGIGTLDQAISRAASLARRPAGRERAARTAELRRRAILAGL